MRRDVAFRIFRLRLDRKEASQNVTVVLLTCDPNPFFEASLASVKAQTIPPCSIEIIRNITPVSKAEQEGLVRVKTRYYLSVDADMILDSDYIERLYFVMDRNPQCAQASLLVSDPILGDIMAGGRMYRTACVKAIGFHPFHGARDHDRYMSGKLKAQGFVTPVIHRAAGKHHPAYLPHEAYWKFKVNAQKARYYGDRYPCFRDLTDKIVRFWERTHDDAALYALAGLFEGLKDEDIGRELTYEGRELDPALLRIRAFLEATSPAPTPCPRRHPSQTEVLNDVESTSNLHA